MKEYSYKKHQVEPQKLYASIVVIRLRYIYFYVIKNIIGQQ